jgi:hypothetical protein
MSVLTSKEAKELLNGNDSYRGGCPSCGGSSSLSVSRKLGEVAWFCFKASCKEKGKESLIRTVSEVLQSLLKPVKYETQFEVPDYFTAIEQKEHVFKYFQNMHTLQAYTQGRIKLRYDPKQDRAVFLIDRKGVTVDAIGRSLSGGHPKWYRYGSSDRGCWLPNKGQLNTVVVTEDIPSACVASYSYSSLALLGTELSASDMVDLMKVDKVIIALDPDAYSKGVAMAARLLPFVYARAILIPDDLKYYRPEDVKEILDEH